ncbi:hypothetical protein D6D28_01767 [Aureobasidium pullulans]|uniref:Uncharacterized protein n=1 Tax=Aureobasidium pullulans TaxID=5580 RepID=A0A4S8SWH7_AURPU|nr:hypothetical protein D6D28_01767 [Aureobasidium pullulans]
MQSIDRSLGLPAARKITPFVLASLPPLFFPRNNTRRSALLFELPLSNYIFPFNNQQSLKMPADWKSVETLERLIAALIASNGGKVDNMAVARYFNDSFDTIENRCRIYKKAALTLVKDAEDTGRINQDMKKRTGVTKKTAATKKGDPSTPDDSVKSGRVTKRASKTPSKIKRAVSDEDEDEDEA